ncbi:MAG: Dyp-type peroxidase [Jatrophihabitans sp.]
MPTADDPTPPPEPTRELDRRGFLRAAGLTGGGVAVGAAVGALGYRELRHTARPAAQSSTSPDTVSYFGPHQPGVADRAPASMRFTTYTLDPGIGKTELSRLLKAVGVAAASIMAGRWVAEQGPVPDGLAAAGLTVTVGLGGRAVTAAGQVPPGALAAIPPFRGDELQPARSGGDLAVQVCGADTMVVASAARALTRIAGNRARPAWSQSGFLPEAAKREPTDTPRNLLGQPDGTDNPTGSRLELAVWVPADAKPDWMIGGTYLVCRRIRMLLPEWETRTVTEKQKVIGRYLDNGAPLSGGSEHTPPDFAALDSSGKPVVPKDAHIRLTHPVNNSGATMLRRGYSYDEGFRPDGQPEAGLFFQAFQTDPREVFVPIMRKLSASDALGTFIRHESSTVFAIPPGASSGGYAGETLFS